MGEAGEPCGRPERRQGLFRGFVLHQLLEHVRLKDPVIEVLRSKVNGFRQFQSSVLEASFLRQRHAAIKVGPGILRRSLLGAIQSLHRFGKLALGDQADAVGERAFHWRIGGLCVGARDPQGAHHRGTETHRESQGSDPRSYFDFCLLHFAF